MAIMNYSIRNRCHPDIVSEDDSPFLSMADFFSLISLSLIYAMIVLAPQSLVPEDAINVVSARATTAGQQSAVNSRFAYFSLYAETDDLRVSFRWPTLQLREDITISGSYRDLDTAVAWLERVLATNPSPDRLVFYMREDENRAEAHRLFNRLVHAGKQQYPVSIVFLTSGK
jgi:hypothetical protein